MGVWPNSPAKSLKSVAGRWNLQLPNVLVAKPYLSTSGSIFLDLRQRELGGDEGDSTLQKMSRIEAVLFLAREPISSRKLSQHASLADGTEARTLVRQLNRKLDSVGRAFRIEEIAGGFQLVTRQKYSPWLRRLAHIPQPQRLSTPALETLSVVAYRQPINRAEVEAIRGVSCGEILNQLLNRDLVRICGRSEELGRPYRYGTSKKFLELFGLRSLDDLPEVGTIQQIVEDLEKDEGTAQNNSDCNEVAVHNSEEESGVSVSLEQENHPLQADEVVGQSQVVDSDREVRMEDDDYDYDDDEEEDEWEEEDVEDEEEEDDDGAYEEEEDDDGAYEEEEEDEEADEYEDEDEDEDEDGDLDEDYDEEYEDEDEEWEEVEDEEEDAEDWDEDDDDWDDDEEWEED